MAKTTNCPEKQSSVNKARQDLLPMKDSGLPNTWVTLPSMVSARQDFFANKRFWASQYMGDSAFNGVSKYIARLLTGNAHCFHSFGDDLPYLIVHKREQCRYHYDYRWVSNVDITTVTDEWRGDVRLHRKLSAENGSSWYTRDFPNPVGMLRLTCLPLRRLSTASNCSVNPPLALALKVHCQLHCEGATHRLRCHRTKLCRAPYSMLLTSAQVPLICSHSHLKLKWASWSDWSVGYKY